MNIAPGLNGLLAQRQFAQQEQNAGLGQIQGLLGIQNAMFDQQLNPLKMEQLKVQLADAKRKSELVNGLLSGQGSGGSTPVQIGPNGTPIEGGISVPGQAPRASGLLGAVNDPQTVMALKLAGVGDFTEMYKFFNTPQKREGGSFYVNPITGVREFIPKVGEGMTVDGSGAISDAPNYVNTLGRIEGAKERAKAGMILEDVPNPYGTGTVSMPRDVAVDRARAAYGQQNPADPLVAQGFTPQQAGTLRMMDAPGAPPMSMTIPNQGQPNTNQPPQPFGFKPSESARAADKVTAEGRAKFALDRETSFQNSWGESYGRLQQLDLIQNLMSDPNVASGALAESISSLKGVADSLGISVKGKTAEDVISAVTNEMALKMRLQGGQNLMPGAMSNFETKLLTSMSPSMSQSREGRMLLIQVSKAKAEKDMKISEMAADYLDKNGKLDSGFDRQVREYSRANPMFSPERMQAMTELARRLNGSR